MKNTNIIATVGPVTESEEKLQELYDNGVNIIRFNFSHAQHDVSKKIADRVKKLNAEGKTNLSLLLDTKGPEIRSGNLDEKISYETGEIIKMYVDDSKRTGKDLYCDYVDLIEDINIGDDIMVDSGLCVVKVLEKAADHVVVEIMNAATLGSKRHINLPGVKLKLPGITEKDKEDVLFGIQNDYDFIAMSFVRNKDNIQELRDFLAEHNASHIKIISKVENQEAIENLDDIVEYSDGVMVARGDLGIEVPIEKLPFYQKQIVDKCKEMGTFYIVATHLLETMIDFPFPTRAEVSDIYNAVMQNADCLMLSGETTIGKYPIDSVKMMTKVIQQAEIDKPTAVIPFTNEKFSEEGIMKKKLMKQAIALGESVGAKALCIYTEYGFLPTMGAAYKSDLSMYAFTNNQKTANFTNALYNVKGIVLDNFSNDYEHNLSESMDYLRGRENLNSGDKVIVIGALQKNNTNTPVIKIREL